MSIFQSNLEFFIKQEMKAHKEYPVPKNFKDGYSKAMNDVLAYIDHFKIKENERS